MKRFNPFWCLVAMWTVALCFGNYLAYQDHIERTTPPFQPTVAERTTWAEEGLPPQTGCTSAVIQHFGIEEWGFSQCMWDVITTIEDSGREIDYCRNPPATVNDLKLLGIFIVQVDSHVLLVVDGETVVDTAPPRQVLITFESVLGTTVVRVDNRPIKNLWHVHERSQ